MISPPAFTIPRSAKSNSLDEMMEAYERLVIMQTLQRNGWNRGRAATALQISRRRLQYRMRALHFDFKAIPRDIPGRRKRQEETP